jgi:hypothetical protein
MVEGDLPRHLRGEVAADAIYPARQPGSAARPGFGDGGEYLADVEILIGSVAEIGGRGRIISGHSGAVTFGDRVFEIGDQLPDGGWRPPPQSERERQGPQRRRAHIDDERLVRHRACVCPSGREHQQERGEHHEHPVFRRSP